MQHPRMPDQHACMQQPHPVEVTGWSPKHVHYTKPLAELVGSPSARCGGGTAYVAPLPRSVWTR